MNVLWIILCMYYSDYLILIGILLRDYELYNIL